MKLSYVTFMRLIPLFKRKSKVTAQRVIMFFFFVSRDK